jgi:hypothetical protein
MTLTLAALYRMKGGDVTEKRVSGSRIQPCVGGVKKQERKRGKIIQNLAIKKNQFRFVVYSDNGFHKTSL